MNSEEILKKAVNLKELTVDEGLYLYDVIPTSELMIVANECRQKQVPGKKVGWIIDRNINITNVCISGCGFCNFHCKTGEEKAYITTIDEYVEKINELRQAGGNQVLLQGGMHPKLGLSFYTDLFSELKREFPDLKLHSLGPPEVVHLARKERKSYREILESLVNSGMDSLPGAGAEILSNEIRKKISPGKCNADQWLEVMKEAHKMNLVTSATMMYGHIESMRDRIEHLVKLRQVQSEKPENAHGFVTFVPWPFMDDGTELQLKGITNKSTTSDYIRLVAISRIMLCNVKNIQASWLTVGFPSAQLCLYGGANDFGSIMIEENVVSAAGASYQSDAEGIQKAISDAGFEPQYRNQAYEPQEFPGKH
ncbi:MAG: CofH family radical SAM protein [Mariniphaga sp.]|nr:CofH family radical SAM protein [Mariniphaga sp.]